MAALLFPQTPCDCAAAKHAVTVLTRLARRRPDQVHLSARALSPERISTLVSISNRCSDRSRRSNRISSCAAGSRSGES